MKALTWLSGSDQNGRHTVRVRFRDAHGGVQHRVFDLYVRHQRRASSNLADHQRVLDRPRFCVAPS